MMLRTSAIGPAEPLLSPPPRCCRKEILPARGISFPLSCWESCKFRRPLSVTDEHWDGWSRVGRTLPSALLRAGLSDKGQES
jgi:hypothetical protein